MTGFLILLLKFLMRPPVQLVMLIAGLVWIGFCSRASRSSPSANTEVRSGILIAKTLSDYERQLLCAEEEGFYIGYLSQFPFNLAKETIRQVHGLGSEQHSVGCRCHLFCWGLHRQGPQRIHPSIFQAVRELESKGLVIAAGDRRYLTKFRIEVREALFCGTVGEAPAVAPGKRIDNEQEARPHLIIDQTIIAPECITVWTNHSNGKILTTIGNSGVPIGGGWSSRDRPVHIARLIIRNNPITETPKAVAKGISAHLRFLNNQEEIVCEISDAHWTQAENKQGRVDFGIGQCQSLDIAFKFDDTTVPCALSNEMIASPRWGLRDQLEGGRLVLPVELSGEWVKTELRAELLCIRDNEARAGRLEFNAF